MNLSILESTGDLEVVKGQLVLVEKRLELQQSLAQRLRTFLGEWFLDITIGLPYFDKILIKNADPAAVDSVFIDEILDTPGVINLLEFNSDLTEDTRQLSIGFIAESTDGLINFNSEVL